MLKVHEIFHSISGEIGAVPQGTQMLFIRLSGCNLRCFFCDQKEALDTNAGQQMSFEEIKDRVVQHSIKDVLFTGGEPLVQQADLSNCIEYIMDDSKEFEFHIETNGSIFPSYFIRQTCHIVYDYKECLKQRMISPTLYNGKLYRYRPYIKFLVGDLNELNNVIDEMNWIENICDNPPYFAVSSFSKLLTAKDIFEVLKNKKKTNVIINVQLHKILGLD